MTKPLFCRGCGKPIIFIKSINGKHIPCDPEQITYWQSKNGKAKIVTPNGEVVSAELTGELNKATGIGYVSHFATCPYANSFRREHDEMG